MSESFDKAVDSREFSLYFPDEKIFTSYDKLKIEILKVAKFLKSNGVSSGDKLLIYGEISYYYVAFILACAKINAIGMLFSEKYGVFEIEHVVDKIEKFYAIDVSDSFKFKNLKLNLHGKMICCKTLNDYLVFNESLDDIFEDDCIDLKNCSYMTLSSGTSGNLKLSHLRSPEFWKQADDSRKLVNLLSSDTILISTPLYHMFSLSYFVAAILSGCNIVLFKKFSATTCIEAINHLRVSVISGVPSVFLALVSRAKILTQKSLNIRSIICSGDILDDNLKNDIFIYLDTKNIYDGYGMSEIGVICIKKYIFCANKIKLEKTYMVANDIKLDLANPIYINDIPNYEILVKKEVDSPYFKTGDLGICSNNSVFVTGRKKDIIVKGGQNISPNFIVSVLRKYIYVKNIVVFGISDYFYGQDICICIESDFEECSLKKNVMTVIGKYLSRIYIPKKIIVLKNFPILPTKKIDIVKLKEMYGTEVS